MQPATAAPSVLIVSLVFGGLLTFTGFVAPQLFRRLPEGQATMVMRGLFPAFYLASAIISALATALLAFRTPIDMLLMGFVCLGFLIARFHLMPLAQDLHDARIRGEADAQAAFASVHRRANLLNVMQIVASAAVLVRLAMPGG